MKKYIVALLLIVANPTISCMEERKSGIKRSRSEAFGKAEESSSNEKTSYREDNDLDEQDLYLAKQLDDLLAQSIDGPQEPVNKSELVQTRGPKKATIAK